MFRRKFLWWFLRLFVMTMILLILNNVYRFPKFFIQNKIFNFVNNDLEQLCRNERTVNCKTFYDAVRTSDHQNNSKKTIIHTNRMQKGIMSQKSVDIQNMKYCNMKRTNVAFLKVHKAGSTTVMTIFLRFAEANNLNVVFPRPENYLGFDKTINLENIYPPPLNQTYNILCNHVIYNKMAFRKYMPQDTVFIAIVRNPVTQIISAAQYFDLFIDLRNKLGSLPGQQLMTIFLKNPNICNEHEQKFVKTRMSLDFGIPRQDLTSEVKVIDHLHTLNKDFLLVMVMEKFAESLVLMKRYLCWDMKDIVYVPLNALPDRRNEHVIIEGEDLDNLKRYNWPDFVLYDYFNVQLSKRIAAETNDFYDEVKTFKEIVALVGVYCKQKQKSQQAININGTKWNDPFCISNKECDFITKAEIPLMNELVQKYKQKLGLMV